MKRPIVMFLLVMTVIISSCSKDKESERFTLLTSHTWTSDSLLVNGVDASGPGEMLELFKGDANFNKDGTGTFGQYSGTWNFTDNETNLAIISPELQFPIATHIVQLTAVSLKVTFSYTVATPTNIRMTFKAK